MRPLIEEGPRLLRTGPGRVSSTATSRTFPYTKSQAQCKPPARVNNNQLDALSAEARAFSNAAFDADHLGIARGLLCLSRALSRGHRTAFADDPLPPRITDARDFRCKIRGNCLVKIAKARDAIQALAEHLTRLRRRRQCELRTVLYAEQFLADCNRALHQIEHDLRQWGRT